MKNVSADILLLTVGAALTLVTAEAAAGDREESPGRFIGVTAGLGIQAQSMAQLADYMNAVAQPAVPDKFDEFNSVADLFLTPEVQVSEEWSIGIDYALQLRSFTVRGTQGFGASEFAYAVQTPILFAHYLIPGEGYWMKVGGGAGYQWGTLTQKLFGSQEEVRFRAHGIAIKLQAVAATRFDKSFYGTIGVDLRWNIGGVFRLPSGMEATAGGTAASLGAFAVGLRFGVLLLVTS